MMKHDGAVRRFAARYQRRWDRVKLELKRRVTGFEPLVLQPYRSNGGNGRLRVIGRLIEERGIQKHRDGHGVVWNIANTLRRFESDEIPDALVEARFRGRAVRGRTDHEGFFDLTIEVEETLDPGWLEVEVEVLESMAGGEGTRAVAEVMVPPGDAEFAVISDIDDTVLKTRASEALTQLRLVLSRSAREHSPMPGAAPFSRLLEAGPHGDGWNPFFFVSRTGWGLYDLVVDFLEHHEMPRGPVYLQDIAIIEEKSPNLGSPDHKRATIGELIHDYPELRFVLMGDSGQDDPEIYRDIARDHTDHVRAVLIRSVTSDERDSEVRRIIQEIIDLGVPAAAAESSVSLARAAADFELIPQDAIDEVREGMVRARK